MEIIFSIAALIVLCFALVAGKGLITKQCFCCCWAMLRQHHRCLYNIPPESPSRLGVGKVLGWYITRIADPNWPKEYSTPYDVHSTIKAKRKQKCVWGRHLLLQCLSSRAITMCTEALLPGKCLDIGCWWEVENKSFVFFCFHVQLLPLLY